MRILKRILSVFVVTVILVAAAVAGVRTIVLPATACTVSEDAIDALKLETSYDSVRAALGCEGVLVSREVWGTKLVKEVYHWRGTAWPFGRFEALFYNGVMHGTEKRWINLQVTLPAALSPATSVPN